MSSTAAAVEVDVDLHLRKLNHLPDLCLLAIFDVLPIPELLQLDAVCSRWRSLQPTACRRRRQVTLVIDTQLREVQVTEELQKVLFCNPSARLPVKTLTPSLAQLFTRKLPAITKLEIALDHESDAAPPLEALGILFTGWSASLRFLAFFKTSSKLTHTERQSLLNLLDHLPHLETLYLHLDEHLSYEEARNQLQMPVFDRLRDFHLGGTLNPDVFADSFARHVNTNWRRIRLHYYAANLAAFTALDDRLAQSVDTFAVHLAHNNLHLLPPFIGKFIHITQLSVFFRFELELEVLVTALVPLHQLKTLTLHYSQHFFAKRASNEMVHLPQLPTVERFFLRGSPRNHDDYSLVDWSQLFPRLNYASLSHWKRRCTVCGYTNYAILDVAERRKCDRALVERTFPNRVCVFREVQIEIGC